MKPIAVIILLVLAALPAKAVTTAEADAAFVEGEWSAQNVPFTKLGVVTGTDRLEVKSRIGGLCWTVDLRGLRAAWRKDGYWE